MTYGTTPYGGSEEPMGLPLNPIFTPPTANIIPPFAADTKGVPYALAKYRNNIAAGVTVYKLSDGTYVQDYPTAENSNTNIPPYPLMPDNGPTPNEIDRTYGIPGSAQAVVDTLINPYVVFVYYGGRNYAVTQTEAAALTAYTAHGIGYGGCIH